MYSSSSLGYSKSTFKTQSFELLLLHLLESKSLRPIYLNPPVERNLYIAIHINFSWLIICFYSCFGSQDFTYLLMSETYF